jgi:hypothetical protein
MRIYHILTKDETNHQVFIEETFSIFALTFQGLWLLYHKMWFKSAAVLITQYIIFIVVKLNYISGSLGLGIEFIIAIILAMFAKTWYIEQLKQNKYQLNSVITANNADEAKIRFYKLTTDYKNVR